MTARRDARWWTSRVTMAAGVTVMISTFVPFSATTPTASGQALSVEGLELTGTGAWSVTNQMGAYSAALYNTAEPTLLSYLPKGDRDGRHVFAVGDADFVISGRPFTAADTEKLAERKVSTITAPFSVGSAAFFLSGPFPNGLEVYTPDPDPEVNGERSPFTGVLRMPNSVLANVFVDRGISNNWYDNDFTTANASSMPDGSFFAPILNPLIPVVRSDPSAENYYVQKFAAAIAPEQFLLKVAESKLEAFEIGENWPFLAMASRTGSVGTANLVAGGQNPKEGVVAFGGVITATPVSEAIVQRGNFPDAQVFIAAMQNGAGEWVQPTPESINIAIDHGGASTEMPGLAEPVPGAYPLVWVNNITVEATGHNIAETNALATLMRVGALTSRGVGSVFGEGGLSAPLVIEALEAADKLVSGNCATAGGTVVRTTKHPTWPKDLAAPTVEMALCQAPTRSATSTTTIAGQVQATTPTTTATGVAPIVPDVMSGSSYAPLSPGAYSSGTSDYGASLGDVGAADYGAELAADYGTDVAAALETTGTAAPTPVALAAVELPLAMPDDGRGNLDRMSTLLLGAVVVFVGRWIARSSGIAL